MSDSTNPRGKLDLSSYNRKNSAFSKIRNLAYHMVKGKHHPDDHENALVFGDNATRLKIVQDPERTLSPEQMERLLGEHDNMLIHALVDRPDFKMPEGYLDDIISIHATETGKPAAQHLFDKHKGKLHNSFSVLLVMLQKPHIEFSQEQLLALAKGTDNVFIICALIKRDDALSNPDIVKASKEVGMKHLNGNITFQGAAYEIMQICSQREASVLLDRIESRTKKLAPRSGL